MGSKTEQAYELAKERYAKMGVDTEEAVKKLLAVRISFNAWQLDDDKGFLQVEAGTGGGVMATGNYPGAAKNAEQLVQDAGTVFSLIPGRHKLSVQSKMIASAEPGIDLDRIEKEHYRYYVDWAKENGIGLDFNPSCSGHPMANSGFTLSSADERVREFWIEHFRRASEIGEYLGQETGIRCMTNYWIPDGYKDMPADMYAPRKRLEESLDRVFDRKADRVHNMDSLESKLFGIGVEAYTVGSHEFYMAYAAKHHLPVTLDAGHFHISEEVANKISSLMFLCDEILLHVTRPMRWDSDHVVAFDDTTQNIMNEIVRNEWLDRVHIGTDYFDASINRVAAGVIGLRNTQKALLKAFLEPTKELRTYENEGNYTKRLALMEEMKTMPFQAVWDHICEMENVPVGFGWFAEVERYEKEVQLKRQ
ncbi:L-rhamnose isomerase [Qiania dongpingensis]|uniref:L-rhamnose isomerase n=1 Tax=Qiania dongpingensis TaxID=2763669 RepID=A0A7G9G3U3_9FIRM|nr:L-rhamnose isomerase [Qiania dongpingensis]QNM05475.1 L-rhamnose isomerase [Qiania dongpingensis]